MGMNNPAPLGLVDDILRPNADENPLLNRGLVTTSLDAFAQLGTHRIHVAGHIRACLLCCGDDAVRRGPL